MLQSFFLLPLSLIPIIAPLNASSGDITPASQVQVAKVPLPELSRQQWIMLRQQQGSSSKPLRLDVQLSIDQGRIYGVNVWRSTGHPDVDTTVVNWIRTNWETASWFAGGDDYVVSFDVNPAIRQIVFRNS